ncbi:hypothetical protein V8C86DRAFT_24250 [Haematococcus lacustris]
MGDLVAYNPGGSLSIVSHKSAEQLQEEQEKRNKDAAILEEKLKIINEEVPTRVYNTCSSSAGAGSGDFHMYRLVRKAEQERLHRIDIAYNKKKEMDEFETRRKKMEEEAAERTAKKRLQRQKKKQKKKSKASATANAPAKEEQSDDSSDNDDKPPAQADLD